MAKNSAAKAIAAEAMPSKLLPEPTMMFMRANA
jgi:hypothetical protein